MKQALEKRLGVALAFALVFVFLIGAYQCQRIEKLADAYRQAARSRETLGELELIGLLLDQGEAERSAWRVTSDDLHLKSSQSAGLRISESLHRLRGLWEDSPSQQKRLEALQSLMSAEIERLGQAGKGGQAKSARGKGAAPPPARLSPAAMGGDSSLEAERQVLRAMEVEERRRLETRTTGSKVAAKIAILAATLGSGLVLWLLTLAALLLRHYIAARRARNLGQALSSQLLDSMTEGVWLADEGGPVLYANPACEAMFGYEQGELLGIGLEALVDGRTSGQAAPLVTEIQRQLTTHVTWRGELTGRRKDGSRFSCQARISTLELTGTRHWLAVQEAVPERKPTDAVAQLS